MNKMNKEDMKEMIMSIKINNLFLIKEVVDEVLEEKLEKLMEGKHRG